MRKRIACVIAAALLLSGLACFPAAKAEETEPTMPPIVDETWTPIEDHTFDNLGYVLIRVEAPPADFDDIIYVQVQDANGEIKEDMLTILGWYIGGLWLPPGQYTFLQAYTEEDDRYLISCASPDFTVSKEQDARMILTMELRPEEQTAATEVEATGMPTLPECTEASLPTNTNASSEPTVPPTVQAETTLPTVPAPTEPEAPPEAPSPVLPLSVLLLLTVGTVFLVLNSKKSRVR